MQKDTKQGSSPTVAPIPAVEIEAHPPISAAGMVGPPVEPHSHTFYIYAPEGSKPHPSVSVERLEQQKDKRILWRVDLELGNVHETHRKGLIDEAIGPHESASSRGLREAVSRGLDGYRPPHLGASFNPQIQAPVGRTLYEFRGRRYRPLYVFGSDDCQVLLDTAWPWLSIGKIITSDGTSGSGALVGGRVVLTARHVRPERSIAAGNWWMKFIPHYFDGSEPFGSSFISNNRYFGKAGDVEYDMAHDFMVCRLFEPLGERLGFFGSQEYTEDWNEVEVWASVGYPNALSSGEWPTVQLRASVEDSEDSGGGQVFETEADLTQGNSGGPFWAWFPTDQGHTPRIIGVVSSEVDFSTDLGLATIHDHDNSLAGGADMVDLVDWARDNWK